MAVSLLEVIEAGGYDISTKEDAIWILSKRSEFERLIEKALELVENDEDYQTDRVNEYLKNRGL